MYATILGNHLTDKHYFYLSETYDTLARDQTMYRHTSMWIP